MQLDNNMFNLNFTIMKTNSIEAAKAALNGNEKNQGAKSQVLDKIRGYYASTAENLFRRSCEGIADKDGKPYFTDEKFEAAKAATKGFSVVYTMPAEGATLTSRYSLVNHEWNHNRPVGKRWYKIGQEVESAVQVLRAYDSYFRYIDDKENGARRIAKSEFNGLSTAEMQQLLALWKAQRQAK